MPRQSKPPGTSTASAPASTFSAPSCSTFSASTSSDVDAATIGDAGVDQRFVDRLVGVVMLDVLADDGDGDIAVVTRASARPSPASRRSSSGLAFVRLELFDDQLVELVVHQAQRHLVDRVVLVALFDDRPALDVAELGDLLGIVLAATRARCGK